MIDVVVPYFKAGPENNELCIWVASDFLTTEEALGAMERGVPRFADRLRQGRMEVFPHTDSCLKGGSFELQRTLDM